MVLRNLLLFFLLSIPLLAQNELQNVPANLLSDADAVVIDDQTIVTLSSYSSVNTYKRQLVTVYNRNGLNVLKSSVHYNNTTDVKKAEVKIYDKTGKEIKKYKKRDFIDVSASGGSLYTDDRMMYIDYYPTSYPFTYEFVSEIKSSSTAFLPRWSPASHYDVSVVKSSFTIMNEKEVPLITRKYNVEDYEISAVESPKEHKYTLKNFQATKKVNLSPHFTEFKPVVKVALQKFRLENHDAYVKDWKDFGLWQKNDLLAGRDIIPKETIAKINDLVRGVSSDKEKTKLIYEFMQNKTRYISIQVGIGGWQPTPAEEVDELSYGDCKGLTNYTKALLKSQNITSYYTIVDSEPDGRDLDEDFVALQGDHVILTVPFEDETVFLECTSQQAPFNYLGTHTDDRKVLMITPTGGVITKTHTYRTEDNVQSLRAVAVVSDTFSVTGTLSEVSEGIAYGEKHRLENAKNDELSMYYKEMWNHLDNLQIENIDFINNKDTVTFTENLTFSTTNYVSRAGDRFLFNPNVFNRTTYIPDVEEERKLPIYIRRGRTYKDEVEILLPDGYKIEAAFEPLLINSEFGTYKALIEEVDSSKIIYKREFTFNSGTFPKESYNDIGNFWRDVVKKDKSKIVLVKV